MKKLIAMVLTIAMVLSMVIVAGAADFTDAADIDVKNTEAVTVLSGMKIIAGMGDGTFAPNATLTRAQAAKILAYVMLGADSAEALSAATASFSDVPTSHWACKYVEYCAQQGIVAGIGNGKFGPDSKLTGFAFGKMLLVAIGFNAENEGLVGATWEKNTNSLLKDTMLNRGVTVSSSNLRRQDACHLALNALFHGETENPESTLAFKAFGVMRMAGKGEKSNLMRPTVIYSSTSEGKYWEGTDLLVNASPYYIANGSVTGGKVYELVGNKEIPTEQILIYRNGVMFNNDPSSFTNNIQEGVTKVFDRAEAGVITEFYYDGSMDNYTFVMHAVRAGKIMEVTEAIKQSDGTVLERGSVTLDNGLVIPADDFTAADIGTYCMYNGYSTSATWITLTNGTEAFRGNVVTGVLGGVDNKNGCSIGSKSYNYSSRFTAVRAADYIGAGGAAGDTVKALVNDGIIYAIWQ